MAHSDDDGLVLPPKIAPIQVVIIPIYKGAEKKEWLQSKGLELAAQIKAAGIRVQFDDNDNSRPGWKFAEYEMKGVPVRIAFGLRELENNTVELARRDTKEKMSIGIDGLHVKIQELLIDMQQQIFKKALAYRDQHISKANSWEEFEQLLDGKGGFVSAHWDGTGETEEKIKQKAKATIRCIPLNNPLEEGKCILTGKPSIQRVLFARAY